MSNSMPDPQPHTDQPVTLDRYAQHVPPVAVEPYEPGDEAEGEAARAQEIEALNPTGYVRVELAGTVDGEAVVRDVVVQMPGKWKASTMRVLHGGNMDAFMAAILTEDSLETYYEIDPDQDQIGEFIAAISEAAGESVGKSGGRSRSSTRMRRK